MRKGLVLVGLVTMLAMVALTMPGSAAEGRLSSSDRLFLRDAASGGLLQIRLGQAAQEKGESQAVKDLGQSMVAAQLGSMDELKEIAARNNVKLPAHLELKHKTMAAMLARLSGGKFDQKYLQVMIKGHVKDVARFRKAAKKVKDPELNAWIVKTVPVLEQQLQQAKDAVHKPG